MMFAFSMFLLSQVNESIGRVSQYFDHSRTFWSPWKRDHSAWDKYKTWTVLGIISKLNICTVGIEKGIHRSLEPIWEGASWTDCPRLELRTPAGDVGTSQWIQVNNVWVRDPLPILVPKGLLVELCYWQHLKLPPFPSMRVTNAGCLVFAIHFHIPFISNHLLFVV